MAVEIKNQQWLNR